MRAQTETDMGAKFAAFDAQNQRRERTQLIGDIEFRRQNFPRHVVDAKKLYSAMKSDGLLSLARDHEGNPQGEPPSVFMTYIVLPDEMLVGDPAMRSLVDASTNKDLYSSIHETYFGWRRRSPEVVRRQTEQGLTEDEKNARRSGNLFDETFGLVKQLDNVDKQRPED